MKVWFDGETAQESPRFGVRLEPGENEFDDVTAQAMLKCGLVRASKGSRPLSTRELKAGKEPSES